ncbi:MAG: FadD3 family acyl-CoA ligase [Gammaproteobacteria bacterium]|nr:FadD3 family acyl-CoA ligase [Gammaproteobacteria bacterium]
MHPQDCPTTPKLLAAAAKHFGDRAFIEEGDVRISFAQFHEQCRIAAAALLCNGFKKGQKAAIWAPNMHQWIIAALAVQYAGGILVTVNTRYKGNEAASILSAGSVNTLFCVGNFLDNYFPDMLPDDCRNSLQEIVVFGDAQNPGETSWAEFLQRGQNHLAEQGADTLEAIAASVQPDDASDILFTSGTTGAPKGVITAHAQNLKTFAAWTSILGLDENDRYLVINPFFHSFGYKAGILACLLRGTTLIPHKVFDADAVLQRIQSEQISMLPGPPTLFQSILAHPRLAEFDISSLKKATTGAATIAVELIHQMRSTLGIDTVITAYGLSECCGLATMCRRGDSAEVIAHTSGRALPDIEVRCIGADGAELPAGEAGEIVVRGYNVMTAYLDNPEATAETIDEQGWLHTGDIGVLDEDGNLAITDRLKDMFITGGFNCYPAEIENQLVAHPDINMAAIIGIPDERMGEVAMAWLVKKDQSNATETDIISWCRENMANYKVPRLLRFVEALPMNASGKVLKTELRAMHNASISNA